MTVMSPQLKTKTKTKRFLYLEFVSLYVIHQQFNIYSPKKDGFQGTFSTDLMITLYQDKILDIVGIMFKNYL